MIRRPPRSTRTDTLFPYTTLFRSVSDGLYSQLATKYRTRFGRPPYRLASLGYDSVLLTVRIARDWTPGSNFPTSRLLAADGFAGSAGSFRCNTRGIAHGAPEVSALGAGGFPGKTGCGWTRGRG